MERNGFVVTLSGLLIYLSLTSGCSHWNIQAQGMGDVCNQYVQVDIVGINHYEKDVWNTITMQDYWLNKTGLRQKTIDQGYTYTAKFGPGRECKIKITEKDAVWKKWKEKNSSHFVILVDSCTDPEGWRVILPLSPRCWKKQVKKKIILFHIQANRILPITTPKSGCL